MRNVLVLRPHGYDVPAVDPYLPEPLASELPAPLGGRAWVLPEGRKIVEQSGSTVEVRWGAALGLG